MLGHFLRDNVFCLICQFWTYPNLSLKGKERQSIVNNYNEYSVSGGGCWISSGRGSGMHKLGAEKEAIPPVHGIVWRVQLFLVAWPDIVWWAVRRHSLSIAGPKISRSSGICYSDVGTAITPVESIIVVVMGTSRITPPVRFCIGILEAISQVHNRVRSRSSGTPGGVAPSVSSRVYSELPVLVNYLTPQHKDIPEPFIPQNRSSLRPSRIIIRVPFWFSLLFNKLIYIYIKRIFVLFRHQIDPRSSASPLGYLSTEGNVRMWKEHYAEMVPLGPAIDQFTRSLFLFEGTQPNLKTN